MVNKVILVGNLGADPELRSTASGTAVCSIRVATTSRQRVGDEWQDKTEWHSVVVWSSAAEFVSKYGAKGRQVYVEGRLQTRKWQDKDGNDRYSTEVVAEVVKLLGSKPAGDQGGEPAASQQGRSESRHERARGAAALPPADGGTDFDGDDIPF